MVLLTLGDLHSTAHDGADFGDNPLDICSRGAGAAWSRYIRLSPSLFAFSNFIVLALASRHRFQEKGIVMQTTPPYELAYANAALTRALFDVLASKGILTRDDFDNILTAAIGKLEPMRNISSTSGAISYIKGLLPEIREST
jgi:hypothetical protein